MTIQQEKLSISTLLFRHSPKLLVLAVVVGALAGALYSQIIPFVLRALQGPAAGSAAAPAGAALQVAASDVTGFFLMCMLILVAKAGSVILVNNIAKSAMAELRLRIARQINAMRIADVEGLGFARLLNVLIDDVNHVSSAAVAIPMVVVSAVTVVGMLAYLASINLSVFLIVLAAIVLGVAMFQVPVALATSTYERARSLRDVLQEGIRGLIMGVYELKLDTRKSAAYLQEEVTAPQRESVRLEKIGDAAMHLAGTASDLLSFFIIGLVVFVLPRYVPIGAGENVGVVMALLYIAAPVAHILGMMQHLRMGQVAIGRIHRLGGFDVETVPHLAAAPAHGDWREFRVQDVSYTYKTTSDAQGGFGLQPVSLVFQRGQINFIVGGNGSGKSTLSKLISLHYASATGGIYFDDVQVTPDTMTMARARIGVIFSNYYLFSKLYRQHSEADRARIAHYLDALQLSDKTSFVDGRFTTTRLSDGQRRRLALLVALLEDKDIYIFDEWAADQDPDFKKVFYREILPQMKRDNKLVIVITHDDRYFDCADRLVFMEDGQMTEVREQPGTGTFDSQGPAQRRRA